MGRKGSSLSSAAVARGEAVVTRLGKAGDVSTKRMFGGVGVFAAGRMFAIIDSAGALFFREGPDNRARFDAAGAGRHSKMPYRAVPDAVWADPEELARWARSAMEAAASAR